MSKRDCAESRVDASCPLAWSVQNSGCGSQSYSGFLPEVRGGCRQGQQALGTLTDLLAWPPWQPMGAGFGHQLQGGEGGSGSLGKPLRPVGCRVLET